MSKTDKNIIKNWFKTGLKPTQEQFWSTWDSFWHKDEKLSISNIENLENVLNNKAENKHNHAEYATNDATSLNEENIMNWQAKLGIEDLEMTDESVKITEDYSEFGLKTGNSIKSFNSTVYSMLSSDNLGSNFANTDLEVDEDRKHTGESTVDFGMPLIFSNPSQKFSGLQDRSNDVNYIQSLVKNVNGDINYINNPYQLHKSQWSLMSIAEKEDLRRIIGGNMGDSGEMSIVDISPNFVENKYDSVEWFILRGANLKLGSTASIEILEKETKQVVRTIPSSQIINEDSQELRFYTNMLNFPVGVYILRIITDTRIYESSQDFTVVVELDHIDLNSISWDIMYADGITPSSLDYASGANFNIELPAINSALNVVNLKTNELFGVGEDFYIEMIIDTSAYTPASDSGNRHRIGLGYSSTPLNTFIGSLINFGWTIGGEDGFTFKRLKAIYNNDSIINTSTNENDSSTTLIKFYKTGNLFRTVILGSNISKTYTNNSGYSIFAQFVGRPFHSNSTARQIIQGRISKAAKIIKTN
jgi:hypothetical protein